MNNLFAPFQLKNLRLKNRIVMPSLASFLFEEGGVVTDRTIAHYRRRAAGGPGMVIVEACAVSPEGLVSTHQARIYDDRFIPGLSRLASAMKNEGAVPAVQIHHAGRQTSERVIRQRPVSPSPLPCPSIKGEVAALDQGAIRTLVRQFGDAADRAVRAGFELIEIHGAHGYLINQFLSAFSNIRDDEYGGGLTRRNRFAREVVEEIRRRIGHPHPLSFKISAQEFVPDGLTVGDSIRILKQLVEMGIDIVQVSAGNDATPEWICQPMFMEKACLSESAAQIRTAIRIPVMTVGRINDPVIADSIIADGLADLVCMGRGLLADPDMPIKAAEGRFDEIRKCIACNTCMASIFRKGHVECLVNPTLGRETEMELTPANPPKKVMVVGGGPGGLNAAWIAALRGHHVELFEKEPEFGGLLRVGAKPSHKRELLSLIAFQVTQLRKSGVSWHLNVKVDLEIIKEAAPDVVIVAAGSIPIVPEVDGVEKPIVADLYNVLRDNQMETGHYLVVGAGATGCETALHLARRGCRVTVLEALDGTGLNIETITRKVLFQRLKSRSVIFMVNHRLVRVVDEGAVALDGNGREKIILADKIVFAVGNSPRNGLYQRIKSLDIPVYQVGDCVNPGSAQTAIFEGAEIGRIV
ncbi:MAG: FAD-dependent oxidoreductase [Desulfobacteraceae bacterium]|nr:FAD-dependent oxidoreductase [Desulfobacteraceae bacterium]